MQRPHTTVVACVRQPDDPTSASLNNLPTAADGSSRLVVYQLRDRGDFESLYTNLERCGISYVDVVIANAGNSKGLGKTLLQTEPEDVIDDCTVNAAGPLQLFRSSWPLLEASITKNKEAGGLDGPAMATRFILISSVMGSIGTVDDDTVPVGLSYSMSKAAANYFAKKASFEFKDRGLVAGILHPGWVQTSMGQKLAGSIDIKEPPLTVNESSRLCLDQIDSWTMANTGKFLSQTGRELPW